jgi:hypothetical protein
MRRQRHLLLQLALIARVAAQNGGCVDQQPDCSGWAQMGECTKNPMFMLQMCRRSCNQCDGVRGGTAAPSVEAWELEDLERPYPDSAIIDVRGDTLAELAAQRGDAPIFVWFYAPWCKQVSSPPRAR